MKWYTYFPIIGLLFIPEVIEYIFKPVSQISHHKIKLCMCYTFLLFIQSGFIKIFF
jgi:hypothetical protein